MKTTKPGLRPDVVPKGISKSDAPPASEWHEWDTEAPTILPGHFVVDDLLALRLGLRSRSICPKVQLSGKGIPKALRDRQKEGDVVIHERAPEAQALGNREQFAYGESDHV